MVGQLRRRDVALRGAAGRLTGVLTGLGVPHDVKEYPDAGHSFMNRHNAARSPCSRRWPASATTSRPREDAWARILRFFDEHLRDDAPRELDPALRGRAAPGVSPARASDRSGGGVVRRAQEPEQVGVRVGRGADVGVGEEELAEGLVEAGGRRLDDRSR